MAGVSLFRAWSDHAVYSVYNDPSKCTSWKLLEVVLNKHFKSVSHEKTTQEMIQLLSPISLKLGTNFGFGEKDDCNKKVTQHI